MSSPNRQKPVPTAPDRACEKCGRPLLFVRNLVTGKVGPADLKTCVYVVFQPMPDPWDTSGHDPAAGPPGALTAKEFLDRLESVTLRTADGGRKTFKREEIVGLYVSHFNTCPHASHFSQGGRAK